MKTFQVKDIPASSFFSKAIYLDTQFIITAPEMPITDNLLKTISQWGFNELFSDGEAGETYSAAVAADPTAAPAAAANADLMAEGPAEVSIDRSATADLDKIQKAEVFYNTFLQYVKKLYVLLPVKNDIDFSSIAEEIKGVCDYLRDNRRYLMRTQWLTSPSQGGESQLITHTARSTIIAVIIGYNLKLQNYRLIELGVAALLHEIGMIKLPMENYTSKQSLTDQERKLLYAHPILGYNMLKSFDFPLVICVAALEHHERENGSGYPQKKTGDKITLYAKIIAVACSYEAMSSSRPHKDAKDGHTGILELLKNEGKQYDETVVRALVYSLSLYPIGLYVLLSNDKKGQVVDVNPENPRYPIVEVFGELLPNGKNKTMRTSPGGVTIVRPLTPEEVKGK